MPSAAPPIFPTASALIAAAIRELLKENLGKLPANKESLRRTYESLHKHLPALQQLEALYMLSETQTGRVSLIGSLPISSARLPQTEPPEFYTLILGSSDSTQEFKDADCFLGCVKESNNTLLHWAVGTLHYHELVEWLLIRGSAVFVKNKYGITPITCILRSNESFELFYRYWLIHQPDVDKAVEIILYRLGAFWSSYDITNLKPREDFKSSFDNIRRPQQRREDLEYFFSLFDYAYNDNRYAVWKLIAEVNNSGRKALRSSTGKSFFYDTTRDLLAELITYLKAAEETHPRLDFICEANRFLLATCTKREGGLNKAFSIPAEAFELSSLPVDRASLQRMQDAAMIIDGMKDYTEASDAFYEQPIKKSAWGAIWGYMQGMAGWLLDYEEGLQRRIASPLIKSFTENLLRLATRESELREYMDLIREIFGNDAFDCKQKTPTNGFNVRFRWRDPESFGDPKAPSIMLEAYLKFPKLLEAVDRGRKAARGIFGVSDLHDIMARYANAISGVWSPLTDADIGKLHQLRKAYKAANVYSLKGAQCELGLLQEPVVSPTASSMESSSSPRTVLPRLPVPLLRVPITLCSKLPAGRPLSYFKPVEVSPTRMPELTIATALPAPDTVSNGDTISNGSLQSRRPSTLPDGDGGISAEVEKLPSKAVLGGAA